MSTNDNREIVPETLWNLTNEAATAATMANHHIAQANRWITAHGVLSEIEAEFRAGIPEYVGVPA